MCDYMIALAELWV